jgi:hypothetical protein
VLTANHMRRLYRLEWPALVLATQGVRLEGLEHTLKAFSCGEGVSAVFTPALVEVRVNQYTSAGLAKGCQPQIFVGR